jgi:hypothetical protein
MSAGNVVSIGIRAELGGLQSDMQKAASAVTQASENMAKAQLNVKQASMAASEAFKEFTAGATKGSQEASDALLRAQQALNESKSAVGAWRSELKAADAALVELIAGEKEEEQALRGGMSARMAASAELRVLEGNMMGSTRAAGAFLSTLPGIGTAMQAAFPVFGAVAVVAILGQAAEAAHKLYDEYVNLRSIVNIVNKEISEEWSKRVELSNEHLENTRKIEVIQAELTGPKAGRAQRGREAGDRFDEAQATDRLAIAQSNLIAQQERLNELKAKASGPAVDDSGGPLGGGIIGPGQSTDQKAAEEFARKQVEVVDSAAKELKNAQQALTVAQTSAKLHGIEENEKVDTAGNSAAKQVAEAKLHAMETEFAAEKAAGDTSVFAERNYWQSKLSAFQTGSEQYLAVLNKVAQLSVEAHRLESESVKKYQEQQNRSAQETIEAERKTEEASKAMGKVAAEQAEDILHAGERWKTYNDEVAKAAEIQTQSAAALATVNVTSAEAQGANTRHTAAVDMARIHAEQYRQKLAELDAEMKKVAADSDLTPSQKATQLQGLQNQSSQVQGQAQVSAATDQNAISQSISQPYITAFNSINNQWLQLQDKLIFGTRNVGRAFANMGVGMLEGFAASVEKMAVKAVEADLKMLLSKQITTQQQVAITAIAAGQTTAIKQAEGLKQALIDAKSAAVSGWKAGMALPFPADLIAAPALAAAGFAGAIAQFDVGGIIPGSGAVPILGHGGERVLTQEQTRSFERLVNNTTNNSGGNASTVVHVHGFSDRLFRDQLARNAEHVTRAAQRGLRNKGRS